jgi:hypothetical protein
MINSSNSKLNNTAMMRITPCNADSVLINQGYSDNYAFKKIQEPTTAEKRCQKKQSVLWHRGVNIFSQI